MEEELIYIEIGKLIRKARSLKGWTQEQLSEKVGLTRVSITNIEKGNQKLSIYNLYLIADVLGVNPISLLPDPSELQTTSNLFGNIQSFKGQVTNTNFKKIISAVTKYQSIQGDEEK